MRGKTIWVVVADEAIARLLRWPETGIELEPIEEITDPSAQATGAELRRDAHGRRAGGAPAGSRPNGPHRLRGESGTTASAGEDEQHLAAEAFARRVAQRLAEHQRRHAFDELRIAAAPRFLGLLRKALSPQVAATVAEEVSKDLTHANNREIADRLLPTKVAARAGQVPRMATRPPGA